MNSLEQIGQLRRINYITNVLTQESKESLNEIMSILEPEIDACITIQRFWKERYYSYPYGRGFLKIMERLNK